MELKMASPLNEKDLKNFLREVISFMRNSEEAFDNGLQAEAKRLAVCIRILVHDMDQNPSLLTRLGLKNLYFYDNSPDHNPKIELPFSGLAVVTIGAKTPRYMPRFGGRIPFKKVSFDEWWNKPVVIDQAKKVRLTRGAIALNVANALGGEADKNLNEAYNSLIQKYFNGPAVEIAGDQPPYDAQIEFVSVRQMAFELLKALGEQLPEYFQALPH